MAFSAGTVVAGYTIESVLGSGGMGVVYRAAHPSLPRSDALKILSEEFSRDQDIRARFLREADLAATLDHPNIATVYDRGETPDGRLWIAMQYVAGSDADQDVRDGRMTPPRAAHIIASVGTALDYAHRRHILHRDVKPANFLLSTTDEGEDRVLLADFGIARALGDSASLTQTGTVMASIAFTAPESLKAGAVDHRADIYSLGCSLYVLLTGKTPFFRSGVGGVAGVAAAHLFEPPPKATDIVPSLPAAIDDVIAKAMAKEPDERYRTAGELAAAVGQALTDAPASRTQPWRSTPPLAAPPSAQHTPPGMPAGEISYPSGYFSGPNAAGPPAYRGPPPQHFNAPLPAPAPGAPRRRMGLVFGALALVIVIAAVVTGALLLRGHDQPAYQAQTFNHVHGSTDVTQAPQAVAALGPGDADAVLSLGVQPVVMTAPKGQVPSWEQAVVTGKPSVLSSIDTATVAAAKPDLIIATGDIDNATFDKLAGIAPTVTRSNENPAAGWNWETQLDWVGRILGRQDKAQEVVDKTRSLQGDLSNQNAAFKSKSVEAVTVTDDGVAEVLAPSFAADYLTTLGFQYQPRLQRLPVDTGSTRPIIDENKIYQIETDYLLVIRTDSAAGRGGFGGLPKPFTNYSGHMVIVDDPNVIAALADPGGYLAVKYLNDNLVSKLAGA